MPEPPDPGRRVWAQADLLAHSTTKVPAKSHTPGVHARHRRRVKIPNLFREKLLQRMIMIGLVSDPSSFTLSYRAARIKRFPHPSSTQIIGLTPLRLSNYANSNHDNGDLTGTAPGKSYAGVSRWIESNRRPIGENLHCPH